MSSQLLYSLKYLDQDGFIRRYNLITSTFAQVVLSNGKTIHIFIADDRYLITAADITEAASQNPKPDYIVRNAWQNTSTATEMECVKHNIAMMDYMDFRKLLTKLAQE